MVDSADDGAGREKAGEASGRRLLQLQPNNRRVAPFLRAFPRARRRQNANSAKGAMASTTCNEHVNGPEERLIMVSMLAES
jgi:hypothetical protein